MEILRGKKSSKYFGWKLTFLHYTLQYTHKKLGVYNSKTHTWLELI